MRERQREREREMYIYIHIDGILPLDSEGGNPKKKSETAQGKDPWLLLWGCGRRSRGNCCDLQQWENVKGSCRHGQFIAA